MAVLQDRRGKEIEVGCLVRRMGSVACWTVEAIDVEGARVKLGEAWEGAEWVYVMPYRIYDPAPHPWMD